MVGSVLAIYAVSRVLAIVAVALNSALSCLVYIVYSRPSLNDPSVPPVFDCAEFILLVISFLGFLWVLTRDRAAPFVQADITAAPLGRA
jgi:apolipoprotein N-acyltransferase